jgi:HK97 family phage portal protein
MGRPKRAKRVKARRKSASSKSETANLTPLERIIRDAVAAYGDTYVSEETALKLSAVSRAVDVISDGIAVLPMMFYARLDDGKIVDRANPLYSLLHDQPNPTMTTLTPSRFFRLMMTWALLWGSGRAEIQRDFSGSPVALWPIHPSRVITKTEGRTIYHEVLADNKSLVRIPDENVINVFKFSLDGINAISVIARARQSLGLAIDAEGYGSRFFKNNAQPSVVLEHPGELTDKARENLRQSWIRTYGGENSGGVGILEEGVTLKPFSMPNDDAQFLETRQFSVTEIARWFGVNPFKLFDYGRATWGNMEQVGIEHDQDCRLPWVTTIEEECNAKLLTPDERSTYFYEFKLDALLRVDAKTRSEVLQVKRRNGIINADEWRALDNENPVPDGKGTEYLVSGDLVPVGTLPSGRQQGAASSDGGTEAMARAWATEIVSRLEKIEEKERDRGGGAGRDGFESAHRIRAEAAIVLLLRTLGKERTTQRVLDEIMRGYAEASTVDQRVNAIIEILNNPGVGT